jgi:hypothetical protein
MQTDFSQGNRVTAAALFVPAMVRRCRSADRLRIKLSVFAIIHFLSQFCPGPDAIIALADNCASDTAFCAVF